MKKKLASLLLVGAIAITGTLSAFSKAPLTSMAQTPAAAGVSAAAATPAQGAKAPKYIFMFIGDGMSYPQIQLTNYFLSANDAKNNIRTANVDGKAKKILTNKNNLVMTDFPVAGSAQTYDSTSFAPDSASTATSLSTGYKTWSGSINVSEDFKTQYETISEKLKRQKDYKIGIVSSVNLNHATPAAYYAHQSSRGNYYEIGQEMIASGFDYFAGGALLKPTGKNNDQKDIYQAAAEAGYKVVKTQAEAAALTAADGKAIVIDENLADGDAMNYDMDLLPGQWTLADYVKKGIEVLNNDNGFFMMVEGGKIDWAGHANDAAATISDTVAFDEAVAEAVKFYESYPEDTLIIVTGDHETGGLTIGYAGTDYDTFLTNLNNQQISYAKFDSDYVEGYKANRTDFNTVMQDITRLFGLKAPDGTQEKGTLVMTQYEYDKLKQAYDATMSRTGEESSYSQDEYINYGTYEPLSVTITHILNNKSGISFTSYSHTGLPVAVFAKGQGQDQFGGYYDNTDIYKKLAAITGVN